jgi:hypothetical protein
MSNNMKKSHLHLVGIVLILCMWLAGMMAPGWAAVLNNSDGNPPPADTVPNLESDLHGNGNHTNDGDPDEDEITVPIAMVLIWVTEHVKL